MIASEPWPDVVRVGTFGVAFDLAPEGLRHLTVAGFEVLARLYTAVRADDWGTVAPAIEQQIVDVGDRHLELTRQETVGNFFRSRLNVRWAEDGVLTAVVTLVALEDVSISRWGFNACLEAGDWAGAEVLDGVRGAVLPDQIAPQRTVGGVLQGLFPPADQLRLRRRDGLALTLESTGQVLEAEDQRNWTDPTFKVYSGSLSEPRPLRLTAGHVLRQLLRMTVRDVPSTPRPVPRDVIVISEAAELPRVGVQANDGDPLQGAEAAPWLAALHLDHIRVDVECPEPQSRVADITEHRWPVELAALVPDLTNAVLEPLAQAAGRLPRNSRVLLHLTDRRTTNGGAAAALARLLPPGRGDILVIPGSDAYFTDLNRDRPHCTDAVSFSITPTVHSTDTEALFETLPYQTVTARQARQLAATAVISPITLRLRGRPEVARVPAAARRLIGPLHVDDRLGEHVAAAWTVGSVYALAVAGAYSGTWHELVGPRGLVRRHDGKVSVTPTFHAIAALRAAQRPTVRPFRTSDSGVVGLLYPKQRRLLLASQRPWQQRVDLQGWTPARPARRRLRTEDAVAAAATLSWWEHGFDCFDDAALLTLDAFEISVVQTVSTL